MFKDFFKWHEIKQRLHEKIGIIKYFYEREIWWCCVGANIGHEQDGKNELYERPIVILRIFNKEILWALPLTTKEKDGKYYYPYEYKGNKYSVILSQLRLISSRRLIRKIGVMPKEDFKKLRLKIRGLL